MTQFSICFWELRVAEREAGKYSGMWLTSAGAQRRGAANICWKLSLQRELYVQTQSLRRRENSPAQEQVKASRRHTSRKKRKGMRKRRTDRGRGATGSPGSVRGAPRTGAPQGRGGLGRKREQWKEG